MLFSFHQFVIMDIRDKKSVLTEWILKFAIIFFISSLFFESYIRDVLGGIDAIRMGMVVKIIIISVFGILLSVLEKNIFKIIGFGTIIIVSIFKILIYISQEDFNLTKITELADFILLIAISIYYLQRHFRKSKRYRKHHSQKSTEEKSEEE